MPRKANTRAASGAGSIRQRPDGRWEARVTVGNDPGTGKPIRRSIYGNTQKEVLTAMRDAQKAIDDGLYIEPTRLTLAQWLDIWQSDYLLSQKYGTVKTYKAQIATHIKPALGAVKLTKLTPHIIQGFYNDLLANGRIVPKRDKQGKIIKKDGVAVTETAPLNAKTVRNVHGVLTKALSQAVKVGYIARNPCDMVDLPRVEKAQIMPLTDEQVKSYLAAADTDNDYGDILKVILFTGLREAEALGLTWDCVDFKKGTLKICKQLQKRPAEAGGFQFAALKNDKTRILRPAPFVMELPAYHVPAWGNVFRATWERGWSFIKRAGTVILAATIILWFLQGFGFENGAFTMVEDQDNSVLAAIATKVAWIFAPLGFGNWRATVASVSGLIAKENVVGTFGVLYHFGGELSENGDEIWAAVAQDYTALSAYAFMIFNLLCAPCFAAMGAIKREMNNGKWTAIAIGYMCALAYCAALVVYQLGGLITGEIGFNFFTIVAAVVLVAFIYLMVRPNKYAGNNEVKIDVTKI